MIYELRTYTLHNGKMNDYLHAARTIGRPARGQNYGTVHGYWTSEFGSLNQVWHLWSYDSLDERARLRAALSQNERWTKEYVPAIRPLMMRQDIRLLHMVHGLKKPAEGGGFYELRMYRMQPGRAAGWAQAFKEIMPVREKYSQNVGIWLGEAPQPNEVLHMWHYPSLDARTKARAAQWQDPDWLEFVRNNAEPIVEVNNVMLIPTDYSPMQ